MECLAKSNTLYFQVLKLPSNNLPTAPEPTIPSTRGTSFLSDPFKKSWFPRIYLALLVRFKNWSYQKWNLYMNAFKCVLYLQNQISSYLDSMDDDL